MQIYDFWQKKSYICQNNTKNSINMGMKDKAMFALYLAAKKRKANNNRQSNNYDDYESGGFDDDRDE